MSMNHKSAPKFVRAYVRGMLRSAFVSLFWAIIMERRKQGAFTLAALAKALGANKGEVSRWFNGDPNWTVNTIAAIADALNVEIRIQAIDRETGAVFTPAGIVQSSATSNPSIVKTNAVFTDTSREDVPLTISRLPANDT